MYFVKRNGSYINCAGGSFEKFMDGQLEQLPNEIPTILDWEDHLSTIFTEIRLKRFIEFRGADTGPWRSLCALPALWVGLLYDSEALNEAESFANSWTLEMYHKAYKEVPLKGLDLIVVDYLQLMQSSSGDNRQQEIAEISRNLKNLARELRVPILALSQLNRAAEAREDKRPRLGDLRESGAIEQDADIVMMLYRDDYYNPGTEIPGVAEVNIVKNRSGQTGKVELFFSKEFTQFSNYSKQEQQ